MNKVEVYEIVRAAVSRGIQLGGVESVVATTVVNSICPEGHTIEVFGPDMERTEEDGKIVWQKKKPYWTVEEGVFWVFLRKGENSEFCGQFSIALPDAKERAEQLAAEMNRDYPNGLPK